MRAGAIALSDKDIVLVLVDFVTLKGLLLRAQQGNLY
jgi:hypothetical protein